MHVLACGFLGNSSRVTVKPEPVGDLAGGAVLLCPGGFGTWGGLCGGSLHCRGGSESNATNHELASGVRAAAFGWEHVVILTAEGGVSTCAASASAADGSEGSDSRATSSDREHLSIPEPVSAIAAGEQHSLALTRNGELYAWGANSSGQLGLRVGGAAHPQPQHVAMPPIPHDPHQRHSIVQVGCGARHSCAVTEAGALLCWGWNLHGQCGGGEVADRVPHPQLVPMPPQLRCKQVSAGLGHTAACFSDGSAYAWGLNTDGQLGLGHDRTCTTPQLVDAAALEELDVVKVACGACHTVFLTACGKAFACGLGKWGQLGTGDTASKDVPGQIMLQEGQRVHDIACGWWSTMLLVD